MSKKYIVTSSDSLETGMEISEKTTAAQSPTATESRQASPSVFAQANKALRTQLDRGLNFLTALKNRFTRSNKVSPITVEDLTEKPLESTKKKPTREAWSSAEAPIETDDDLPPSYDVASAQLPTRSGDLPSYTEALADAMNSPETNPDYSPNPPPPAYQAAPATTRKILVAPAMQEAPAPIAPDPARQVATAAAEPAPAQLPPAETLRAFFWNTRNDFTARFTAQAPRDLQAYSPQNLSAELAAQSTEDLKFIAGALETISEQNNLAIQVATEMHKFDQNPEQYHAQYLEERGEEMPQDPVAISRSVANLAEEFHRVGFSESRATTNLWLMIQGTAPALASQLVAAVRDEAQIPKPRKLDADFMKELQGVVENPQKLAATLGAINELVTAREIAERQTAQAANITEYDELGEIFASYSRAYSRYGDTAPVGGINMQLQEYLDAKTSLFEDGVKRMESPTAIRLKDFLEKEFVESDKTSLPLALRQKIAASASIKLGDDGKVERKESAAEIVAANASIEAPQAELDRGNIALQASPSAIVQAPQAESLAEAHARENYEIRQESIATGFLKELPTILSDFNQDRDIAQLSTNLANWATMANMPEHPQELKSFLQDLQQIDKRAFTKAVDHGSMKFLFSADQPLLPIEEIIQNTFEAEMLERLSEIKSQYTSASSQKPSNQALQEWMGIAFASGDEMRFGPSHNMADSLLQNVQQFYEGLEPKRQDIIKNDPKTNMMFLEAGINLGASRSARKGVAFGDDHVQEFDKTKEPNQVPRAPSASATVRGASPLQPEKQHGLEEIWV